MGVKVGGSIRELCIQGCSKGSNDINWLALHNKKAKFACDQSASRKEHDDITNCHFQNISFSKITS